jgi:hypothetical protein
MTDRIDNKISETSSTQPFADASRRSCKPYLAHHGRGSGAVLVVVDGRNRFSSGIACRAPSSPRARRRLKKMVLARYLRDAADQAQRGDLV